MSPSHYAFVDESGDRGTRAASSDHFVFGGYVIAASDAPLVGVALRGLRTEFGCSATHEFHYHRLNHHRRLRVAEVLGGLPITSFLVAMCKRAGGPRAPIHADQLYNWGARLLLERLSWYMRDSVTTSGKELSVTFAHAKGYQVAKMHSYVNVLKGSQTEICWTSLSPKVRFSSTQVDERLQVADALSSAAGYAFQEKHGHTEQKYLQLLAPTLWRRNGRLLPYGLKQHPNAAAGNTCPTAHSWVSSL